MADDDDDDMIISNICKGLFEPCSEEWHILLQLKDVSFYSKKYKETGLQVYRVVATINFSTPEILCDFSSDAEYIRKWNISIKDFEKIDVDGKKYFSWEVGFPFPLSNRFYVFTHDKFVTNYKGKCIFGTELKGINSGCFPDKTGTVRVKDYHEIMCAYADQESSHMKVIVHRYEDLGLMRFPNWLIKYFVKIVLPPQNERYFEALKQYTEQKKNSLINTDLKQ